MIRDLIARGIGFNPGSTRFIPTHGLGAGTAAETDNTRDWYVGRRRRVSRRKCGWMLWLIGG